jgi:titin
VPTLTAVDDTEDDDGTITAMVKLTWSTVAGADTYDIRKWGGTAWSTNGFTLTDDNVDDREYVDADSISANTQYYYVIRAVNGTDMGDWSRPASTTTKALVPDVPTELNATARGESRIWVSWAAPATDTDNGAATSYTLQWRHDSSSARWNSITVQGTTYAHMRLSASTNYFYRVRAENSGGMSDWTAEEDETTWSRALSTPTGLTTEDATEGTTPGIKLTWNAVTGATSYEIQRWNVAGNGTGAWGGLDTTGTANDSQAVEDDTTYTDGGDSNTGLAAGMTFYYIVKAVSGGIQSDWTAAVAGTTKAANVTGTQSLDLEPTGMTSVRLTWNALSDDAISYQLEWVQGVLAAGPVGGTEGGFNDERVQRNTLTLNPSPIYYLHTGRTAGSYYSYRIRAVLPLSVMGPWSDVENVITRPVAPTLTADDTTDTTITLKWDFVSIDNDGDGDVDDDLATAANYNLERRKSGESTWMAVDGTATCEADDGECTITDDGDATDDPDGLTPNTRYFYRIRATADPTGDIPVITSYWAYRSQTTDSN